MDYSILNGKKVIVTGATGLIGKAIVKKLLTLNAEVIAIVRDKIKAENIFGYRSENIRYVVSDICSLKPVNFNADYIIHAAAQTSSKAFVIEPVETIMTSIIGTKNMLELARVNPVKSFVYLSSMEIYGSHNTDDKIDEHHSSYLDTMDVRSSYPESKRMCENLCRSYAAEFGIPSKVVRLTQTFGPGVQYNDTRVFAEFARAVIEKKDIILQTKGETKRNYLYIDDAVSAILMVLLIGKIGEAYNAANEQTYCSIYEMACMVASKCANGKIKVITNVESSTTRGFAPTLKMNLSTSKLCDLGWKAKVDLIDMFNRMIEDMSQ